MTVVMDDTELEVTPDVEETENEPKRKRGRVRDFTKSSEHYDALAEYINANSGLDPISPLQVKAALALKTDFSNLPEQKEARDQRKAEREAEARKYEGMSEDQIKAAKAAKRVQTQAEKLAQRAKEALEKAQKLQNAAAGSGEDLAAFVESQNAKAAEAESAEPKKRRGIGRRKSAE